MTARYVALLRGINVGGKNLVSMAELRSVFEEAGYESVRTYIQSGNVVFETSAPATTLESAIERLLADRLETPVMVVVRSQRQLARVISDAPAGFGVEHDRYLFDVVFLKRPLTPKRALDALSLRDGVDRAWPGTGVLYFSRLSERRAQSRFSRLASTPEYRQMTIRNWNTTAKLLALLDQDD